MLTDKQRSQTAQRQSQFRKRQKEARRREQMSKGLPATPPIPTMPGHARWRAAVQSAGALITQVVDEMSAYYDDRSERWQESDAATEHVDRQEALEAVLADLEQIMI